MKFYLRYLSLLFCLVLSLSLFSLTVSASTMDMDLDVADDEVSSSGMHAHFLARVSASSSSMGSRVWTVYDGTMTDFTDQSDRFGSQSIGAYFDDLRVVWQVTFAKTDGSIIAPKGRQLTLTIDDLCFWFGVNGSYNWVAEDVLSMYVIYTDGTTESLSFDELWNNSKYTLSSSASFTPSKAVRSVSVSVQSPNLKDSVSSYAPTVPYTIGTFFSNASIIDLHIEQSSEESGLLSGILGWVKNVYNKVSDGFSNLGQGITNVFNSILELPAKLWNLIEEGLKSLFVPSEDDMIAYKDRWQELLADRLGAVYQVTEIIFGAWDEIQVSQETKTIDIPSTTIPLPQGNSFTFGGYSVRIVPEGFDWLATSLKLIIGVLCTFLFINALRHRYDEVMGVEK